jgi:hypothetical protein
LKIKYFNLICIKFLFPVLANAAKIVGLPAGKFLDVTLAGLGLIFIIVDLISLIKDWEKQNPSLEDIKELTTALKNDIEIFKTIFKIIKDPDNAHKYIDEYKDKKQKEESQHGSIKKTV